MNGKSIVFTALLLFVYSTLYAQEDVAIKNITMALADQIPVGADLEELTERLAYLSKHPLDLNHILPEQLKELIFLSPLQINSLFLHIESNGQLLDLTELQAIPAFDIITIGLLLPFVTLIPATEYAKLKLRKIREGNSQLLLRYGQVIEQQKGFTDLPGSRYLGSPQKLLLKYRYQFGDLISASLVMKKDAGESFFKESSKQGFDFMSGSLSFNKAGRFDQIIIGDYSLQFGQGLTLWSGFSFGKGADVSGVAKRDTGLKPYTSSSEYSFFRGITSKINILKIIGLTTFISLKNLDASLTESDSTESTLSNINKSGLHRTATEIRNKGAVKQLLYGTVLQYSNSAFTIGLIAYHSTYQHEFTAGRQLYNQYSFTGKSLTNAGIHYNYNFRNLYFFGEAAQSLPGGLALLNGVMASLTPKISAVVLYRNYAKDHINFYSQGIGEGAESNNEKGIYAGININPNLKWNLSFSVNTFQFPWLRYRINSASQGHELTSQLTYLPSKSFRALLSLKTKLSFQNLASALPFNTIEEVKKENYRLQIDWKLNKKISFQSRVEASQYQKAPAASEFGYLIYHDVEYKPLSSRISGNMRLAWFSTASYDSRVYAYEDDVLYASGSGLYNGKGIRTYLNLKYRLSRQLNIWGKYLISVYPDETETGSGLDEIPGSKKSEFKLQLSYQF